MANDKPTYEELEKRLKELEKSLNQDLRLINTRLQLALNSANIGIHEWKVDTNEFIWDSRIYEFWGLPNKTPITNELFQKGVHPDDLDRVLKQIERLFEKNSDGKYFIQYRVIGIETNIERWVEFYGQMHYENGHAKYFIGTAIDITEQQQAQELNLSKEKAFACEEKYRLIIANSTDAIIIQDVNGGATYISPQLKDIFGYEPDIYIGHSIPVQNIFPEDLEKCMNAFKALQEGSEFINIEYRFYKKNGEIAWVQHTARKIFLENGKVNGIQNNIRDITIQKKVLEELRISNFRYQTLFDQGHDGIIVVDPETGSFFEFNNQVCKQLGYSREEFAKIKLFDIEIQETAEQTSERIKKVLINGKDEFITKHKTKQGEIRDVKVVTQIIEIDNKKFFHSILSDITELKIYEKELIIAKEKAEDSNYRSSAMLNAIPDLVFRINKSKIFLDYKADIKDLYFQNDTIIGKNYTQILPHYVVEIVDNYFQLVFETGRIQSFEYCLEVPNIGTGYYEARMSKSGNDEVTVIVRNITESKKKDLELLNSKEKAEENEQKYKQLFDNTLDHIFIYDVDENQRYKVSVVNPIQKKELGSLEPGKYVDECFPAEVYNRVKQKYNQCIQTQQIISYEENFNYKDVNQTFYTQLIPIKNSKGHIYRIIGIAKSITELKKMSDQLIKQNEELVLAKEKAEESDKLKTAFLLNMSHEIKTPLNSIIGFSDMLNKPELSDEKRKSFTSIIINSSHQLESIVNNILTISVLETKQEKLNIKPVCINNIIVELLSVFEPRAFSHNISLFTKQRLSDKLSNIYSDGTKVIQILTNLINNALKYTHQGNIEFGYDLKENEIEFFVKDTGIGIELNKQEKIFERFVQVETGLARKYGGNGLGLSISKGYVELLGGKIWLESELGKGSAFYFTIPYKPVQEVVKRQSVSLQNSSVTTILVAEDEEFNYLFLEALLIDMDFKLIHAKDGKEAVDLSKANKNINLVLMDIKMPIMDGYTATIQIKEFRPDLPIIAQSAYTLEQYNAKYNKNPFDDYISKPIIKDILKQKLLKYIDKH